MEKIPLSLCLLIIILTIPPDGKAWDGYDRDTEDYIEVVVDGGILPGQDMEIHDYRDNSDHDVQIVSIIRSDRIEIEVYD